MAAKLCNVCGKRRQYTGSKGTETAPHLSEMCNYCYEEGGYENQHSDNGHETIKMQVANGELEKWAKEELPFMASCWVCHPELNLAQKDTKTGTTPKVQGTRRPQLNHKGHSHPQTPAARRACKAAFWSSLTPVVNTSTTEQLAAAMASWNFHCDGNGKEIKATKMTVVPRGPKGGVINQLKKGPVK